jgi:hypothetical protein
MDVFYTGAHHPHWLTRSPVPLFLSATTLARYRTSGDAWPVRGTSGARWAGDSGAYAALMLAADREGHPWSADYETYGGMWARLADEIGRPPDFIAVQDWPCEPGVRARTGLTVREHQEATVESYLQLLEGFPWLPWLPILQGWQPHEHVKHHAMYRSAGVDLTGRLVGVGSICRRGSQRGILAVLDALAPLGMRLHGFGVSINGLRLAGHLLASSDSQAHSAVARRERIRLAGCRHLSMPDQHGVRRPSDCRNCFRWAIAYRDRIKSALDDNARLREHGIQQPLDLWSAA